MIEQNEKGKRILSFETNAIIRRIPISQFGTRKDGSEWRKDSVLLEAYDEDESASAEMFLIYWDNELLAETIERLGVGKKVRVKYHLSFTPHFDNYYQSVILDDVQMLTEKENFLIGKKKKGNND